MWSSEKGISSDPLLESASSKSNALDFSSAIWLLSRDPSRVFDNRDFCRIRVQPELAVLMVVERIAALLSCNSMALSKAFGIAAKITASDSKGGDLALASSELFLVVSEECSFFFCFEACDEVDLSLWVGMF